MTKEEAFKELGIRYVGPNVKAKFFEIIEGYAKERCEEIRHECLSTASNISEEAGKAIRDNVSLPKFD